MKPTPEPKESKFNSAIASLERIHDILQTIHKYKQLCFTVRDEYGNYTNGYNLFALNQFYICVMNFYGEIEGLLENYEKEKIKKKKILLKKVGPLTITNLTPDGERQTTILFQNFLKKYEIFCAMELDVRKFALDRKLTFVTKASSLEAGDD